MPLQLDQYPGQKPLPRGEEVKISPLDNWVQKKIQGTAKKLSLRLLQDWQMEKLKETLELTVKNSPFYKNLLKEIKTQDIKTPLDITRLPFTTSQDLQTHGLDMLCTSQSRIKRVVTLPSSGTKGKPKRVFFSEEDLESTIDFFHHGMKTFTQKGHKVLILMPGELESSVGHLLSRGLSRLGATPLVYGFVRDAWDCLSYIEKKAPDFLVGLPVQILWLARLAQKTGIDLKGIKGVLLSADQANASIVQAIEQSFNCKVYDHYGMTEMGLGGAVECLAQDGYHPRSADLWFEIIDPKTLKPVPHGQTGEVVFTTLTRKTMPLIRYRTNDLSFFHTQNCSCQTRLPRLGKLKGRITSKIDLGKGLSLNLKNLDEIIFGFPNVLNHIPKVKKTQNKISIVIDVYSCDEINRQTKKAMKKQLITHTDILKALDLDLIQSLEINLTSKAEPFKKNGIKRTI